MEINLKKIRKKGKENINQMNDIKTIFKDTTFKLYQFKNSNNNKILSSNDNNIIIKIGITNIYFNKERKIYLNHDNKYKNNINFSFKENKIFIYDLMMYFFIFIILSSINSNINPKLNNDRSIILNINQTGIHKIFFNGNVDSQSYSFRPYEVYINGNQTDEVSEEYNFNQINNIIELKFYPSGTSIEYLFYQCSNITKIDLSNFDTSSVIKMAHLFHGCLSLTSINFTNFKTNLVERMESMFYGCQSLTSLDLSNFETNKVQKMNEMFFQCSSLVYLDITNFKTDIVTDMSSMFFECGNLTSLNLSSFSTSNVEIMADMFVRCKSLTSLDLSNFNTQNVKYMNNMFCGLEALTILDLWNFNTKNVLDMKWMFYECKNLMILNISNFSTSKVESMAAMFVGCRSLTSLDLSSFDSSSVTSFYYMFEGCSSLNSLDLSKFNTSLVNDMKKMFYGCKKLSSLNLSNFYTSNVIDMEKMFGECSNLKYINLGNIIINDNTSTISIIDKSIKTPIICMNSLPSLEKIIESYECPSINCSGNWMENDKIPLDYSSNQCINGCILSKYEDNSCYEICSYYFYYNETINKYHCTKNQKCPESHKKLILDKNECVKSCSETKEFKYEFEQLCLKKCPQYFNQLDQKSFYCSGSCPKEKPFILIESVTCVLNCTINQRQNKLCITGYISENKADYYVFDTILEQTKNELTKNFSESVVNDNIITEGGANIKITKIDEDIDINFGKCKDKLKGHYNISDKESLYLLKITVEQEGMMVPSYEYELYYPIHGKNLEKLDLTLCQGYKINITKKVNLTQEVQKHNSSSLYYNDICYISNSTDPFDISLSDKRNDYIKNNMAVCETNCDFIFYNYETQKAVCSCDIKTEIPFMNKIKFGKNALMNNFVDINNIANIKMISCYKTVFKMKKLIKNYGFIIYLIFILLNIICIILFYFRFFSLFVDEIAKIKYFILNNSKLSKDKCKNNIIKIKKTSNKKKKSYNNENFKELKSEKLSLNVNSQKDDVTFQKNKMSINKNNILQKKVKDGKITKHKSVISNNNYNRKTSIMEIINNKRKKKFNKKKEIENEMKLNYSELNNLEYNCALLKDKRTITQYYISLLKTNHSLLFICYSGDYNSRIIKISVFLYNLSSYIAVNALFFNDSTMHKIYTDKGSYNIIYQLPQIIYSTLISTLLSMLIKILGLSEKNVLEFKKIKVGKKDINAEFINFLKFLKIKFALFFIINFLLQILFCFYITCFCGIYINTQLHLIKDSIVSFASSLITPFFIYLFPAILRILALKKQIGKLYNFSRILQKI